MLVRARRVIAPPVFTDENQTRVAAMLHYVLLTTLGFTLFSLVAGLLLHDTPANQRANLIGLGLEIGMLALLRAGYVRAAAAIFTIATWLIVTYTVATTDGILNPFFIVYIAPILMAGVLLHRRMALVFAVLSVAAGAALTIASGQGLFPRQYGQTTAIQAWLNYTGVFGFLVLMIFLSDGAIRRALRRAIENEQAATHRNHQYQLEIAERRAAEIALSETSQQYQQLLELSPVAVAVYDPENRILYANSAAAQLMGARTPNELLGRKVWDFLPPESQRIVRERIVRLETEGALEPVRYPIYRIDGTLVDVEVRSAPITYRKQPAVIAVIVNVSEQEWIQRAWIEAEALQAQAQRAAEVARMQQRVVTTVSHEFRTPLTLILSSKDILERYYDRLTPEKRTNHLAKIGSQVRHMTRLLEQVLTIERADNEGMEFDPAAVDLGALCREIVEEVQLQNQHSHPVSFQTSGTLNPARVDRLLLQHILLNLLGNSMRYSPEGSPIQLEVRQDADCALIRVSDRGVGIPPSDLPHIFERFYRGSNVATIAGTGLGLPMVKSAVEAHGGTIDVESQPNQGTTVTICLPNCFPTS